MTVPSNLTPQAKQATVTEHYRRLADRYDQFLYYSPDFVRTLTRKMIEKLDLQANDRLVDLGCGTAMYSLDILKQLPLSQPVVGVDPFPEMLARIPEAAPLTPVAQDALAFSAVPGTYDKILIKEAVHHVEDRRALFANLFARLAPGGRLLLVHVPPKLDYPIFEKALRRAEQWHADPDELAVLLARAGFAVERDAVDFQHAIPTPVYFQMVASQYMSVLSSFTEQEIAEGLEEMQRRFGDREVLEFTDHFDYVAGIKAAN
jgi:ubiquinone/menaquinone biosynthesis C-methylase UbiE